jgi:hypothetical protein
MIGLIYSLIPNRSELEEKSKQATAEIPTN